MSTAERIQKKLFKKQQDLKHLVTHTVVPDGYEPIEMMQELRAEDELFGNK